MDFSSKNSNWNEREIRIDFDKNRFLLYGLRSCKKYTLMLKFRHWKAKTCPMSIF